MSTSIAKLPPAKREETGRKWVLRYVDSMAVRHAPTFHLRSQAVSEAERLGLRATLHNKGNHRLYDLIDSVCDELANSGLSYSWKEQCGQRMEYLARLAGEESIESIDGHTLDAVEAELALARSPSVTEKTMNLFRQILQEAVRLQWLKINPFDKRAGADVSSGPKWRQADRTLRVHDMPTMVEIERLIAGHDGSECSTLVMLLLLSGLRIGEALALQWEDIDFDKMNINVIKTFISVDEGMGTGLEQRTKTYSSARLPPIADLLADILYQWYIANGSLEAGYVFTYPGRAVNAADAAMYEGAPWQVRTLNGRRYHFHAFRHACAALWIWLGIAEDAISVWLGHADETFTLDVYGYLFDLLEDDASDWPSQMPEEELQ